MQQFQCRRCSACCRQPGFVYLPQEDSERIASFLHLDAYQFAETHCLLLERRHLALKKNPDESCIFLQNAGCQIYEVRPRQCQDFPLGWKTERSADYCQGLKRA